MEYIVSKDNRKIDLINYILVVIHLIKSKIKNKKIHKIELYLFILRNW